MISKEFCESLSITGGENEQKFEDYFGNYTIYVLDGVKAFSAGRYVYHNNQKKKSAVEGMLLTLTLGEDELK